MKVYVLFVLGGLLCCLSAWGTAFDGLSRDPVGDKRVFR